MTRSTSVVIQIAEYKCYDRRKIVSDRQGHDESLLNTRLNTITRNMKLGKENYVAQLLSMHCGLIHQGRHTWMR